MNPRRVYLDHNAGSPLREEARASLVAAFGGAALGNPSSAHTEGRRARSLLESARELLASLVGCRRDAVIFTSGGTESNALALSAAGPEQTVAACATEHPSVLEPLATRPHVLLPVDADGRLQLPSRQEPAALVTVSLANHETGQVQDVAAVARWTHEMGGLFHTDACQALGRIPCVFESLAADFMSLSAHKLGGPVGIGALIVADPLRLRPQLRGGGQEAGLRAGTESAALASAFAAAAQAATGQLAAAASHWVRWRGELRDAIQSIEPTAVFHSPAVDGLPNTLCVSFPGRRGPALVHRLDLEGCAVSHGSACSTGSLRPSPVLLAMGAGDACANSVIRVSMGHDTTHADVRAFLVALRVALAAAPLRTR